MHKISRAIIALCVLISGAWFIYENVGNEMEVLKVGYPVYWGENLSPSLQHTIYADALMANQFEALVYIGSAGSIKPLAAKSWSVSEDKRKYTFKIDTSRKFSNGEPLMAKSFKESWEYGLSLPPKSANSSLQDVLYKIVGYEDFEKTKTLSGLKALDDETFEIEFKKPFRAALTNLAGSRMAAFINIDDKILGTGPYIIESSNKEKLELTANPFFTGDIQFKNAIVEVVKPEFAQESLDSGKIDVYSLAEHAVFKNCLDENSNTGCFTGNESRHITLTLNSKEDRIFSKLENRLAFQSLFYKAIANNELPDDMKVKTIIDPQIFLPLQAGRIDDGKAQEIIGKGEQYIQDFVEETKNRPIRIISSPNKLIDWIKNNLSKQGVLFSEDSAVVTMKELVTIYYKEHNTDITLSTLSVASGDPDGIYHALGKNGSITSPMMYKAESAKLLEEGRQILDLGKIDEHYQKVTKAALSEVPFVHIGYLKTLMTYRKDKVKLNKAYKQREDNRFSSFSPL